MRRLISDLSLSTATAGFVAVLVGFTSSIAIVFQAATSLGASQAEISSWIWALGIGMGLCSALPSLILRRPVMIAWSTPGAAVLATAAASANGGFDMAQAVGAFLVCAALITICGLTGLFERVMDRIPASLASALLAGVLARFGLEAFAVLPGALALVLPMLFAYLLGRRFAPRYTVAIVLVVGTIAALSTDSFHLGDISWGLTTPIFTAPTFTLRATISLALPLFVVTMASQNLPGVAAIRTAGYVMPISRIIALTGLATLILAPFGAFSLNLAAITAAIALGPEAHEDPARRYTAAIVCGALYILIGLFGGTFAGLLASFPKPMVVALAGLALLGSIGNGLAAALRDDAHREPALITFLVTLSGLSLWGIGAAFWGVVAGALALAVRSLRPARLAAR
jgi:benzoate membrane transport protein